MQIRVPKRLHRKMERRWLNSPERKEFVENLHESRKARNQRLMEVLRNNADQRSKEDCEYLAARDEWRAEQRRNSKPNSDKAGAHKTENKES
jgi:hypothetical protein